jgi:hypothetical protein
VQDGGAGACNLCKVAKLGDVDAGVAFGNGLVALCARGPLLLGGLGMGHAMDGGTLLT